MHINANLQHQHVETPEPAIGAATATCAYLAEDKHRKYGFKAKPVPTKALYCLVSFQSCYYSLTLCLLASHIFRLDAI